MFSVAPPAMQAELARRCGQVDEGTKKIFMLNFSQTDKRTR